MKNAFSVMSNIQTNYRLKLLDFQKVDQHTGGKWLNHGTKHRKDNLLQSMELPLNQYDIIFNWLDSWWW